MVQTVPSLLYHDHISFSQRAVPRGCPLFGVAIRRRPICRTSTRIGRHSAGYLGTERGTITNINIQRPRSLWWYGVSRQLRPVAKNLTSLQHPPCRSAKRTYSVSSSCSLRFSLSLSLSLSLSFFLSPFAVLRFARHLALFLLVEEVPSWPGLGHAGNHFSSDACFTRSVIPRPENMEREISTARSLYTFSVYLPLCLAVRSRAENMCGRIEERWDDQRQRRRCGMSILNDRMAWCINMIFEIVAIRIA